MAKRVKFSEEVSEYVIHQETDEQATEDQEILNVQNTEENEDLLIDQLGKRVLPVEDIEGQEEATLKRHGDMIITPFNLIEECEEGHFDQSGNFIFNKVEKEERDPWLDSINWQKVVDKSSSSEEEVIQQSNIDAKELLKNISSVILENETVIGALKRLNRERLGNKDIKSNDNQDFTKIINDLTGWTDALMEGGFIDIYQKTGAELLDYLVPSKVTESSWFYKWEEDSEEHGPFTTNQILDWKNAGFFKPFVFCRNASSSEFLRSDSIDFLDYV